MGRRRAAHRLGQPPVHHQRLAVLADDDIARLDVAVQHAAAVSVIDCVADVQEPAQELAKLEVRAPAGPGARAAAQRLVGCWNAASEMFDPSLRESPLMNRMA